MNVLFFLTPKSEVAYLKVNGPCDRELRSWNTADIRNPHDSTRRDITLGW